MSSDTHRDVPPRIPCGTISPTSSPSLACHRSHGTILHYPGSALGRPLADDPAVLIGLALGLVRQSDGLTGIVPDTIIDRLQMHADNGDPACRLLLDWLAERNCELVATSSPDLVKLDRAVSNPKMAIIAATEGRIDE